MLGILVCVLLIVLLPYITHEILTQLHGEEFQESFQYGMEAEADLFRVLSYSRNFARVYYVGATQGHVLEFSRNDGIWEFQNGRLVWCQNGSIKPSFVWPYFFH